MLFVELYKGLLKGILVFGFIFQIVNFLDVVFSQWYVSWRLLSSVVKRWEDVPFLWR
jgi:hypothetical protein